MLEPYRTAFNECFTMGKYAELLRLLSERTRAEVEFRVCETPCFFAPELMQRLVQTGEELTAQLLGNEQYMRDSEAAIPAEYRVPGGPSLEETRALLAAVATGIVLRPRGFTLFFAVLTAQQVYSHGTQAWSVWHHAHALHVPSVIVLVSMPAVLAWLLVGRRPT